MRNSVVLLLLAFVVSSCANPFGAASAQGPQALAVDPGVAQFRVTWRPVLGAKSYEVQLSPDRTFSTAAVRTLTDASSPETLDDLDPGVEYSIRVRAILTNGPTAWSTERETTPVWTWARPAVSFGSHEVVDTASVDVGTGTPATITTTYTTTVERHETVAFGPTGLVWSSWLRTSTTLKGSKEAVVVDGTVEQKTGAWTQRWLSFALGEGEPHTTAFNGDRTVLTVDGDAAVAWTVVP